MTHIYDNNLKFLMTLNYNYEDFIKEPSKYFPDWQSNYYVTSEKYENPIIDQETIREKTREELILIDKKVELLIDGEYVEGGKIITVECSNGFLTNVWNKETHEWTEGSTKLEVQKSYYSIIDKLKEDILNKGYNFRGHQQKVREKDKSWLILRIEAMKNSAFKTKKMTAELQLLVNRTELEKEGWVFDTGEIELLDVLDLLDMLSLGNNWSSAVFKSEEILKTKEPNLLITKDDFLNEISKHTNVESWK